MSKHETWRTRKYWESIGGLLIEEFVAIRPAHDQGVRIIDGIIVLDQQTKIHDTNHFDIAGHDIILCSFHKKSPEIRSFSFNLVHYPKIIFYGFFW
jgi:hypothetical protein